MRWRWIIRGVCVALVAVCVAAWVGSYFESMAIVWTTHGDDWRVLVDDGKVLFVDYVDPGYVPLPWLFEVHISRVAWGAHGYKYRGAGTFECLGFAYTPLEPYMRGASRRVGVVPLWFINGLVGLMGWQIWRWTRARYNGKGFPVEVGETEAKKG